MLKPYVCVVCEKVIFSKEDVASLIGLFSKMILKVAKGTEIPNNALMPREWAVFSAWDPEPGDEKRLFVLCTRFVFPDLSQFGDVTKTPMVIESGKRFQVNTAFNGFPIGQAGPCRVVTWIEENEHVAVSPIELKIDLEISFV
jgi:hypothetical protein